MKLAQVWMLALALNPLAAFAGSAEQAQEICSIVDRYQQGSYHYFDCLQHIEKIDAEWNVEQTIAFVCGAVDTFYGLDAKDKTRCFKDAKALLAPEALACWPKNNLANPSVQVPQNYNVQVTQSFQELAQKWNAAYRSKVEAANNGLHADFQKAKKTCLSQAYSVSLDGPNPLSDALKECVFTSINAYSGPAISADNQTLLADAFVQENWGRYRFRKILNASLMNEPIAAFNTKCVLEIQDQKYPGYKFYMSGYTFD